MADEALIAELGSQRELARQCLAQYALQPQLGVIVNEPKSDISELMKQLSIILEAHPVFGRGRNIYFSTKQLNLKPLYASYGLLRVLAERGAPLAVEWLYRLFEIHRAELRMVALVHGLEVHQPVILANGVRLLPFSAAPDSPQFRALASRYQGGPWSMTDVGLFSPAIAVFDMGIVDATADLTAGNGMYDHAHNAILDAARAFTLTDGGAPVVGVSWMDFIESELTLAEFGMMWMSARFEGSPSRTPVAVDGEALAWAERYLQMEERPRHVVDLALDRLNLARRRLSPGDQAIDGGICLEALLGDKDGREITYKLQLRAALLLGNTLQERLEIRKAVSELYNLRSKVVHGGKRKPKDKLPDICTPSVVLRFALKWCVP